MIYIYEFESNGMWPTSGCSTFYRCFFFMDGWLIAYLVRYYLQGEKEGYCEA